MQLPPWIPAYAGMTLAVFGVFYSYVDTIGFNPVVAEGFRR
jgi:hypothetical protein